MALLVATVALLLEPEASAQEVSFACDASAVSCEEVRAALAERLAEAGRSIKTGEGPPRAAISDAGASRVRVEIEVSERAPSTKDVDLAGDPAPAWTVAITIEQELALQEAAAARHERPPRHERPAPPPRSARVELPGEPPSEVWLGLSGGARMDLEPGLAILGGGVAAWTIRRFLVRVRGYGEYAPHDPFRGDAFGVGAGAGWVIVSRPRWRMSLALEAFFRLARWQYDDQAPRSGPELGGGAWLDATFGRWALRPWAAIGVETFFLRQSPLDLGSDESLRPSLVAPTAQLGLVYHPQ